MFAFKQRAQYKKKKKRSHLISDLFKGLPPSCRDVCCIWRSAETIEGVSFRAAIAGRTFFTLDVRREARENDTRVRCDISDGRNRESPGRNTATMRADRAAYDPHGDDAGARYSQQWRLMGPVAAVRASQRRSNGIRSIYIYIILNSSTHK